MTELILDHSQFKYKYKYWIIINNKDVFYLNNGSLFKYFGFLTTFKDDITILTYE